MPIAAVPTFTNGQVPTAAVLNGLAGTISGLALATIGKDVSQLVGSRPRAKLRLLNPQSLATSGTEQFIKWDAALVNSDFMWSSTNAQQIMIQTAGWYRVFGQVAYDSGAAGQRIARLYVNGTATGNVTATSLTRMGTPSPDNNRIQVAALEHLAAGATLQMSAFQDSGAALNMLPFSTWGCVLAAAWVAPY